MKKITVVRRRGENDFYESTYYCENITKLKKQYPDIISVISTVKCKHPSPKTMHDAITKLLLEPVQTLDVFYKLCDEIENVKINTADPSQIDHD